MRTPPWTDRRVQRPAAEVVMLTKASVSPVLSVVDLERARRFYGVDLGLLEVEHDDEEAVFQCGHESAVSLHAAPDALPSPHTVATFEVRNIAQEMRELRGHGVKFEDYDVPGIKTEGGIATVEGRRCAWFKDPSGNVLCLHEVAH
jgi:catechol 2,3-dioxygenase-like lactoylglutathione lyase family enzyme